jgi:acyl carrier protein
MQVQHEPTAAADRASIECELIAIVRDLARELHPQRARMAEIDLASRLERDLGIDSLGRTELILRLERAFHVRLPAETIGQAETVGDLLDSVGRSQPQLRRVHSVERAAPLLPAVPAASEARTLVEALEWHVRQHADRLHVTVLQDEANVLATMTYAQLADSARNVAAGLIARDVAPGDRVSLMLPTGVDFFAAFFGVLYAGAVPVPIYPPSRISQIEEHARRQAGILRNAEARLLVTVPEARRLAGLLRAQVETLQAIETVADLVSAPSPQLLPPADERTTAFIQYTSGSTGEPKGVVLSHANLLANICAIGRAIDASSQDIFVSWLPLYHDLGLIGGWLGSLYFAAPFYVMSPLSFLARPQSWLWAIHRFRATLSASPNFGFELCLSKIADADIAGLDLSSLRMVANGAEPVSAQTLRRFIDRFSRYGFRPQAMAPAYGLAENTVGLTFPPLGRAPLIDRIDRQAFGRRGVAAPANPDDPTALEVVCCGQPIPGHEVRIVDETGREAGERCEGRLEFRGPSATSGYFHNEKKTRELFHDGWLDSGDQAYMAAGEVYVTGRVKDIIIRAGRHIYPQEIEDVVAAIPGIIKSGVAVFGVTDPVAGTERTVILAETEEIDPAARKALEARAHEVATDILGAPPDEVVLAAPHTVPKTSSGKIRRGAAKDLYGRGQIGMARRAVRWQVARLMIAAVGPQLRRVIRGVRAMLYAGWWWTIVGLAAALAWLAVMLLPRLGWRWSTVRAIARAALAAVGTPVSVTGGERIPCRDAVLVFNHASYSDALAIAAVVPGEPTFAAKREFANQIFAGPFLRRLGGAFVDRYDFSASVADAQAMVRLARQGRVLVFFPEGTFTRRAGLSAFYLGAFKVASEANLPVVPCILRGTRSMLRGEQWFPRWSPLSVHVAKPIMSKGTDFASVLLLRNEVRQVMLAHCGEPDLGELVKPEPPRSLIKR